MPFRLIARNVLGIGDAVVDVDGVTLIAGPNSGGKSSILDAAAAAASGHPALRGVTGKTVLRNRDKESGGVELRAGKAWRTVSWPGGNVDERGDPPRTSPVASGAVKFFDLSERDRIAEIGRRVQMDPTPDDVARALAGFPSVAGISPPQILAAASEHGWDALHAEAEKQLAKGEAAWLELTGEKHDKDTAPEWRPASVNPRIAYRMIDFDVDVMMAERRLLDREAIEKTDRMTFDELAAAREKLPMAQRRLNEATRAHNAAAKDLRDRKAKIEGPDASLHGMAAGYAAEGVKTATERLAAAKAELDDAQAAKDRAVLADSALRALARREDDEQTVEEMLAALDAARARRHDFRRYLRAQELQRNIASRAVLARALSPRGIRKSATNRALLTVNRKMVELCDVAGLPHVVIDGVGGCTIGGRVYRAASESERWAADVMVRIAFTLLEGGTITTVPSLHNLQPSGRPMFFRMLRSTGLDVLVELTPKDRAATPDLERARLGRSYWIAGGNIEPL